MNSVFIPGRVDEEKEDIEILGGNLPVYHHRQDYTKTAGDGRTEIVRVVLQFLHINLNDLKIGYVYAALA